LGAVAAPASARAAAVFVIRGGGWGHGVGLSQYGALGYAQHGAGYRQILAHYYTGTGLGHLTSDPTIRVLVHDGAAAFSGAASAAGKHLDPARTYGVRALADGTMVLLGPKGKKLAHVYAPLAASGPAPLALAGVGTYRGVLEFEPDGHGGVLSVDALDLENYIRGVVSAEVPYYWAREALKALAVAARTYAITSSVGNPNYDQYADARSQMYGGVGAETPETDAAVDATAGQVVIYRDRPVVTYFFSSSGGQTENVEDVWPKDAPSPWLRGVPDPYDRAGRNPHHSWTLAMGTGRAAVKLAGLFSGGFVGVQVTRTGASPRVISARVVGTRGSSTVSGSQLERTFGLLSTDAGFFTITAREGRLGAGSRGGSGTGGAAAQAPGAAAMTALVPLVQGLVASATPVVSGTVFPGRPGRAITLERRTRSAWVAVVDGRLGRGGTYALPSGQPGMYRVIYSGLPGPDVAVG
jgi:stage II sporulation protein D